MGRIVAMGGGSIFARNYKADIDREIIRFSGKRLPRVLFIPTATMDSVRYIEKMTELYGEKLHCSVQVLKLYPTPPSKREMEALFATADVIYVGGGNTLKMIARWKFTGVDRLLRRAYERGVVLCGPSAGGIAWFESGNSDSRKFRNPKAKFIRVSALGYIPALFCPHYDSEPERQPALKEMMKKVKGVALVVTEHAAIEIKDDTYRVLRSRASANVYRCYWEGKKYYKEVLPVTSLFAPLKEIL